MADLLSYQNAGDAFASAYDNSVTWNWSDVKKEGYINSMLAAQANQHEIDMWNLQNEYNTPAAQMKRYQDAGLNPDLIYQQGNNGNASSAPGVHQPQFSMSNANNGLNRVLGILGTVGGLAQQMSGIVDSAVKTSQGINDLHWSNMQRGMYDDLLGFDTPQAKKFAPSINYGVDQYLRTIPGYNDKSYANMVSQMLFGRFVGDDYNKALRSEVLNNQALKLDFENGFNSFYSNILGEFDHSKDSIMRGLDNAVNSMPSSVRKIVQPLVDPIGLMMDYYFKTLMFKNR